MSQEFLFVKLNELDQQIEHIHNQIQENETLSPEYLRIRIAELRSKCEKTEAAIRSSLQCTKARVSSKLLGIFQMIEAAALKAEECIQEEAASDVDKEVALDEKLLMAEYELDFAMLAANRALLVTLEAIEQQKRRSAPAGS